MASPKPLLTQPFWPLFLHFTPPAKAYAANSLLDYWQQLTKIEPENHLADLPPPVAVGLLA